MIGIISILGEFVGVFGKSVPNFVKKFNCVCVSRCCVVTVVTIVCAIVRTVVTGEYEYKYCNEYYCDSCKSYVKNFLVVLVRGIGFIVK